MARALREALGEHSLAFSHAAAPEIVAKQLGVANRNLLSAAIDGGALPAPPEKPANNIALQQAIPILPIVDLAKAREFSPDFLGSGLDREHRFAPPLLVSMQVSRSGLTLHLSEHHGDANPGSIALVWMTRIDAYHAEQLAGRHPCSRPGIEDEGRAGAHFRSRTRSGTAFASAKSEAEPAGRTRRATP